MPSADRSRKEALLPALLYVKEKIAKKNEKKLNLLPKEYTIIFSKQTK